MIKKICAFYLKSRGWVFRDDTGGKLGSSFVALGAPHTSNWDFITAMSIIHYTQSVKSKFLIKASWMRFPLNLFFGALGGIGVERNSKIKQNATDKLSRLLRIHDNIALWMSPEGSRSLRDKWKTGFYYIAKKANVPIVLAYADWKTKTIGLGKVLYLTDDFEADMQKLAEFYRDIQAKIPDQFSIDHRYLSK